MLSRRNSHLSRKYSYFNDLHFLIDFKFDPIKSYLDNSQGMILQYQNELREKYNAWEQDHSNNPEMPDAFDVYEYEIIHGAEFSTILNQSTYLTIYSMFEKEFYNLCDYCKNEENLNIGVKDLSGGNYIAQCRKYLKLVININLDMLNSDWSEITIYQKIRNTIAHNNGILKQVDDNLIRFISNKEGVSIKEDANKINIDSINFLKEFIDKISNYLISVGEEIQRQKNS